MLLVTKKQDSTFVNAKHENGFSLLQKEGVGVGGGGQVFGLIGVVFSLKKGEGEGEGNVFLVLWLNCF